MTPGHTFVSAVLHLAVSAPTPPPPGNSIPDLPSLPAGITVPPERTGQIVAAALAILLDVAGLTAVGLRALVTRWRRREG